MTHNRVLETKKGASETTMIHAKASKSPRPTAIAAYVFFGFTIIAELFSLFPLLTFAIEHYTEKVLDVSITEVITFLFLVMLMSLPLFLSLILAIISEYKLRHAQISFSLQVRCATLIRGIVFGLVANLLGLTVCGFSAAKLPDRPAIYLVVELLALILIALISFAWPLIQVWHFSLRPPTSLRSFHLKAVRILAYILLILAVLELPFFMTVSRGMVGGLLD